MPTTHIDEIHRVRGLSSGLDWILMCPDPGARQALLQLVAEEITVSLDAVTYALQAAGKPAARIAADAAGTG